MRLRNTSPALFNKMSRRSCFAANASANARTDANDARSIGIVSTRPRASARVSTSVSAAAAFAGLRAAITTCAPARAIPIAASLPMPLLPPVTTATLPASVLTVRLSRLGFVGRARGAVFAGLRSDPGDELVAVEADLAPAGEPVRGNAAFAHHAAQVL